MHIVLGGILESQLLNFHDMSSLRLFLQAEFQLFLHILLRFEFSMWSWKDDFLSWSWSCFLAAILTYIINGFKDSSGATLQPRCCCYICWFPQMYLRKLLKSASGRNQHFLCLWGWWCGRWMVQRRRGSCVSCVCESVPSVGPEA